MDNIQLEEIIKPGQIVSFESERNRFTYYTINKVRLSVTFLNDYLVRVRYASRGIFETDFSYAVLDLPDSPADITSEETPKAYVLSSKALKIEISKKNLRLRFSDQNGNLLNEDKRVRFEENVQFGGYHPRIEKILQGEESIYGLGDKPSEPNLRGKKYEIWGTDSYGYEKDQEKLYKNIPFYIGCHDTGNYGVFFDNTFRSFFDFGNSKTNRMKYSAEGGELNYYFIYGDSPTQVAERYTELTGTAELPPFWALGYHQCKWSYYPEARVMEIAEKFRELEIPCDVLYLDIDYMDGFRVFTWDSKSFPDPPKMIKNLEEKGFRTVVMIDPGIKEESDYFVCKEGLERNLFCKFADGPLMRGPVWPGYCYFPDFTNPEARDWWVDLMEPMLENGIHGVWNDMNEPAIFLVDNFEQTDRTFPDHVLHHYEGNPCSHRKAHNVYGMQMSRATYDSLKKYQPEKRPFNITRSTYAGGQRYALGWTGDNVASWEHLSIANWQCQAMSVSGFSFIGSDIGGFAETPEPELYARWVQLAVFHPFFRTHSSKDFEDQEPWSFGRKYTRIAREAIRLRYQLLDYLYTAFFDYHQKGTPILKPLGFIDASDPLCHKNSNEFGFGDHIISAAVLKPRAKKVRVYLPKGSWYLFWNDRKIEGGKYYNQPVTMATFPLYIRAGAVIPLRPVEQYISQTSPASLSLHVYYGKGQEGVISRLYEDEGEGYGYQSGNALKKRFIQLGTPDGLHVHQEINGSFETRYKDYELIFHGLDFTPSTCAVDGESISLTRIELDGKTCWNCNVPKDFQVVSVGI